ncbi:MAG: hypothetical protein ACRD22_21970 [Terriglobia bacterium]
MIALSHHALEYFGYLAEIALLVALVSRRQWKRDAVLALYALGFVCLDGVARLYTLYTYGAQSKQYYYCYWLTDVLLALLTFLLVSFFFRRACSENRERWAFLRTVLSAVFASIVIISCLSISMHFSHLVLFGRFVVDLQQNLYFACLVLTTALFLMLQNKNGGDAELGLLVCGLGIEFAGSAAGMALMYLTPGGRIAGELNPFIDQLCNLSMFLIWIFAVARKPEVGSGGPSTKGYKKVPAFAAVAQGEDEGELCLKVF